MESKEAQEQATQQQQQKVLTIVKIKDIEDKYHQELFDMYKNTYSNAGQDLWFKTKEELLNRYPCLICYNGEYTKLYVLYQFKKNFNKISLVCHNGSAEEKENSIKIRLELIRTPGWMLEASGATSWILRKNKAPRMDNEKDIQEALDIIPENKNDKIEINNAFDENDKNSYRYTRVYTDTKLNKEYRTNETLFGTKSCKYETTSDDCNRKCIEKLGGKAKHTKRKVKHTKVKHSKRKVKHTKAKAKHTKAKHKRVKHNSYNS